LSIMLACVTAGVTSAPIGDLPATKLSILAQKAGGNTFFT
jgi:hypothetical protein